MVRLYSHKSLYRSSVTPILVLLGSKCHVALDRNLGSGYNTILLRLITGDLLCACPHRQFHTLPGLLDSRAALSNSYPNACVPIREAVRTIFMMVFDMTWPGAQTGDLPHERRIRQSLSHSDAVPFLYVLQF